MTILIASVFTNTVGDLERSASRAWAAGADAVEARIDSLQDPPAHLTHFLNSHRGRKWIITCRSQSEGGRFTGSAIQAAMRTLEIVQGTGAWIDIEFAAWQANAELRRTANVHLGTNRTLRLLLSTHFVDGPATNLEALVGETLKEGPQVVAKVAYMGHHISNSFHTLDLMHRHGPRVIAICMGETGTWTRMLARKLGAFATFASLDRANLTAQGQYSTDEMHTDFGWERIDADTKVFGVAGDPVAHSLSPRLFNHWFQQHRCNAVFVPLRVGTEHGGLGQFLAECARRPWLNVSGLSVTIPHKVEALHWAAEGADRMSRSIGAANTVVLGETQAAYNTDCYAAVDSVAAALGRQRNQLAGLSVDMLGAGGAARAVCYGLCESGCRVTVFARSPNATKDFAKWGATVREWAERLDSCGEVLVNCTPVGMWPKTSESPMPAAALRRRKVVFDLIYRPLKTTLLADAISVGCPTLGGLDMFVRQAATQFALWTGQTPDTKSASQMLEMGLECEAHRSARRICVALIGARGSGKTSVGLLLARILGMPHVDIDDMVIASSGKTIRQIFAEQGEEEFRRLESHSIQSATGANSPMVISMGGGAVMDLANISQVARVARIVWLSAPADVLAGRVALDKKSGDNRPSLTQHDALTEMQEVVRIREPLYRAAAEFIVDTSVLTAAEVARCIADWLGQ